MIEGRVEVRTPREHLLVCALVEKDGHCYAEVKSRNKSDCMEIDTMINALVQYKNQINIQQEC